MLVEDMTFSAHWYLFFEKQFVDKKVIDFVGEEMKEERLDVRVTWIVGYRITL